MIAVVDYGLGNVRSVLNALEYIGDQPILSRDSNELSRADGLIIPGVGSFGEGMRRLHMYDLTDKLTSLLMSGKPVLGICLGYQMLMRSSTELGYHEGLSIFEHDVVRLPVRLRLPHIGWARVSSSADWPNTSRLLQGIDGEYFYFVHSYAVVASIGPLVSATTTYGDCQFTSLAESANIFGTQFHPEKSGEAGLQLLRNFLQICQS